MFGIDWNGDGKEDMFDDMLTYGMYEAVMKDDDSDSDSDDYRNNGSCLMFMIGMIGAFIIPIAGIIHLMS